MSHEQEARCIYCLETKPLGDFNTEHVLHRAFGGFQGALTLVAPYDPSVCRNCNDEFSRTIDLAITRDSVEALLRVETGLKDVAEMKGMFSRRLVVRLRPDSDFGPLYLAFLPGPEPDTYVVAPVPQVRFGKRDGGYKCYREEDLRARNPKDDPEIDLNKKAIFWNRTDEEAGERLIGLLTSYGIGFSKGELFQAPEGATDIDTEMQWLADRVIARAVAKIAFNYLAKTSATVCPDFVFRPMFTDVRRFIRYDEGSARAFVQVTSAGDSLPMRESASTQDHVLAVTWEEQERGHIIGFVKLFGYAEYLVRLANQPEGIWLDVGAAHSYRLAHRDVVRSVKGRFVRPPGRSGRTVGIIGQEPR